MLVRRHLDFHDFAAVLAEVEALGQKGYAKAGNWDLGQVCDHLATAMRMQMDGAPFRAPWLARTIFAPLILRVILKKREMRPGIKVPPALLPGSPVDEEAAIKAFSDVVARFRDHPGEFALHPFFGKLTPEQARQLHLIHAAHHLGFLLSRG